MKRQTYLVGRSVLGWLFTALFSACCIITILTSNFFAEQYGPSAINSTPLVWDLTRHGGTYEDEHIPLPHCVDYDLVQDRPFNSYGGFATFDDGSKLFVTIRRDLFSFRAGICYPIEWYEQRMKKLVSQ